MKKFFLTLLVLIILAGLGLFFGWAQMGIPPDAYGVIRSKSHGTDGQVVIPGEFRWVWYKLIPTNATTTVLRLRPVNHEFSAKNVLPSGTVYRSFAGIVEESFSWEINAVFSFSLQPEALVPLVTVHNIGTQAELVQYEHDIAGQIEAFILRRMNLDERFAGYMEALLQYGESPELVWEVEGQFPSIDQFTMRVKHATFPDFTLYRQAKGLYESYIALQREYIANELGEKAKNRIETQLLFSELEQYGELLTKYPILLEYLAYKNKNER